MSGESRRRDLAVFQANARDFSAALERGRVRTAALAASSLGLASEELPAVIRELTIQQEELSVAEEELRAQLDELATTTMRARAERDRYRALFDQSPDGYFLTDTLGVIRDVNVVAAELVEVEPRFLIGKPLAALVDVADARLLRARLSDLLRSGETLEVELRLRPRGGEPRWCGIKAVALQDGSGALWIARDTQAHHVASGALSRSYEGLQEVHARRLAELERANRDKEELLARERLLREELVAADAAKDRLIAVLSHDLRGPLHSVLGWTQLLRRETLDSNARDRALATIEQNARAQLHLLDGLLDVSRIASEAVQLERVRVDLSALAREELAALTAPAAERSVTLDSAVDPGIVVTGDRARLQQLLRRLLTRALASVSEGGRVELVAKVDDGGARIVVRDDGRGIAPDLLPTLFQLSRSSMDGVLSSDATGLYLVRRIVELHEGSVTAESDGVGRGSQLTVTVPLPATARASTPPGQARALTGVRVLLVDDDADTRDLMTLVLETDGAIVTAVGSAEEALTAFETAAPAAVVTDLGMPGMSGIDLIRTLRARTRAVTTAFLLVSGHGAKEEVDRALEAGFDAHLTKPIELGTLVATLRDLTASRR